MWRPKRSKSNQQKTFEEQKLLAESQNTLGATVASAGSYIGGWLGTIASTATGATPAQPQKPKLTPTPSSAQTSAAPAENMVSFDNLVKDCQFELAEYLIADISHDPNESDQQIINSIEVMGEVKVKAQLPDETPKV